ncbi:Gfo/Idh/MocA family oxidoreductase [Butyrivibrio sp. AE2032]|uniref:Gfo/Idh/MocA family oxidoreductase n=1 Tax=Butyrivibrio sp. AE2032 TaxID=1458463 RepID=UPI0005522800|nr:Gfo/Idh/MocA family oxidoreductase [Butyrivibrio sp. AE2032]
MIRVIIVGAGNIGSRHLQALANVNATLQIFVVDPSAQAISISEDRFREVPNSINHKFIGCGSIEDAPKEVDLAIISTSSGPRLDVIKELVSTVKFNKLVLEKFLFTNEESFHIAKEIFSKNGIMVWVNTTRRAWDFYKKLKDYLMDAKYISMFENGGEWGMACNAIHEFDVLSMLQGDHFEYTVDTSGIENRLFESKRKGYIEFNGTIIFKSQKGTATITSIPESDAPFINCIYSDKGFFCIEESIDTCTYRIPKYGYEERSCKMGIKPTSTMMTEVYQEIIYTGRCDLPDYDSSMKLHLIYLRALLQKENEITGNKENKICQIT